MNSNIFHFQRNFTMLSIVAIILIIIFIILIFMNDYMVITSATIICLLILAWFSGYRILVNSGTNGLKEMLESNKNVCIYDVDLTDFLNEDSQATINFEINGEKKLVKIWLDQEDESIKYYEYDNEFMQYEWKNYQLLGNDK